MLSLAKAPCQDRSSQQQAFDAFRAEYNNERPHEAAGHYVKSPRPTPQRMPEPDYAPEAPVRKVRSNGEFKWKGSLVYASQSLISEVVAIEETEQGEWAPCCYERPIGIIVERHSKLRRRSIVTIKTQNTEA